MKKQRRDAGGLRQSRPRGRPGFQSRQSRSKPAPVLLHCLDFPFGHEGSKGRGRARPFAVASGHRKCRPSGKTGSPWPAPPTMQPAVRGLRWELSGERSRRNNGQNMRRRATTPVSQGTAACSNRTCQRQTSTLERHTSRITSNRG